MPDLMSFLLPMLGLLIVGIIGITFWLAWVIFKARYKKQLKASKTEPATATTPPFSVIPRDVYLLSVDHTPDRTWEIAVNGEVYPNLEAVPDDTVRKDVVAGLKEVVAFARSYVQKDQAARKPPAPAAPPQPARQPAVQQPAMREPAVRLSAAPTPVAPDNHVPPVEKPVAAPAAPQATLPTDRPRLFLKDEPTLNRSDAAPTIMTALDLAREIGAIVAEMQMRIPSLAGRSIKLQNAPSGGVCFAIDGIVYADVNEIPNPEIRALIRAATKEWERR
ncbi:MAG: hypothetical protein JXR84_28425 [Anaerolineae bacterium]|nr:hypothetical protein [Anaerolineae bacterium]